VTPVTIRIGPKPTLRQAVRTVLSEATEDALEFNEIHKRLVQRGWLRADDSGKTNLYSMLSVMTKANEVERIRPGWYRIPRTQIVSGNVFSGNTVSQ
jgi:hypothetical protein